jgi:hypothetical protein
LLRVMAFFTLPSCLKCICYQVEGERCGKTFSSSGLLPRTQSAYRLTLATRMRQVTLCLS